MPSILNIIKAIFFIELSGLMAINIYNACIDSKYKITSEFPVPFKTMTITIIDHFKKESSSIYVKALFDYIKFTGLCAFTILNRILDIINIYSNFSCENDYFNEAFIVLEDINFDDALGYRCSIYGDKLYFSCLGNECEIDQYQIGCQLTMSKIQLKQSFSILNYCA